MVTRATPGVAGAPALRLVAEPGKPTMVLTRVFDAPRRLVFVAYSRPEHVARWWGRRGQALTVYEMDFRPGGAWRFVLRGADGQEHPFRGVYREIVPPKRLVYTFVYDVPGVRDQEAVETLTFEERDGRTTLTSTMVHRTVEARDGHMRAGMEAGASETLERLAELLTTMDREIVISRVLDAPRELVWEVWTDPRHVVNWWGPNGFTTAIETMDVRPGGVWKHVMHGPDGTDYPGPARTSTRRGRSMRSRATRPGPPVAWSSPRRPTASTWPGSSRPSRADTRPWGALPATWRRWPDSLGGARHQSGRRRTGDEKGTAFMRKLIMWNMVTLDGCFEGPKPWDIDWHEYAWGDELERLSIEQTGSADALLFGRATYEGFGDGGDRRRREQHSQGRLLENPGETGVEQYATGAGRRGSGSHATEGAAGQGPLHLRQRYALVDPHAARLDRRVPPRPQPHRSRRRQPIVQAQSATIANEAPGGKTPQVRLRHPSI